MRDVWTCLRIWVVLLKVLWVSSVFGQVYKLKTEVQSCTAVDCQVSEGYASCVCVGRINDEWVFCSAGHCFFGEPTRHGLPVVKVVCRGAWIGIGDQWRQARVVAYARPDTENDLGWVALKYDGDIPTYCVAESDPAPGTDVRILGFPSGGKFNFSEGTVLRQIQHKKYDFAVAPAVVQGYSGGPVVANKMTLGIVGTSDFSADAQCTGASKIRASMMRVFGRLPDCGKPRPVQPEAPPPPEVPGAEPKPDPISTPQCDCKALEAKVSALNTENAALKAQLQAMKDTPPPEPKPEKRVLYFTSIGNPNTAETDKAARKLKDNGYPITIITLDPTETNVRDVPRAFELPSGKSVTGVSNVITYFATLSKGV